MMMLLLASLSLALLSFSGLAEAAPWSFAVVGDQRDADGSTGVNGPVIQAMANDIHQRGVFLVLCGGDQIHGHHSSTEASLPTMYQNWLTAMAPILAISYPVRGNHETYGEISTPYYPYYWNFCIAQFLGLPQNGPDEEKGMTYSFTKQNALFVGIDQFMPDYEYRLDQNWLDQQLAANILPHVFVYGHLPAVAVTEDLSSMAYYPINRDAFWESLGDGGCQVYLCGHSHLYNRATITITDIYGKTTPPITQLLVGTGGGPLEAWDMQYYPYQPQSNRPRKPEEVTPTLGNHLEWQFGYAVVTIDGNQVSINYYAGRPANAVPTSWVIADTFSYTITSKTLGLNDVSQQMDPQILTSYYPGIAINKTGTGTLTLNAGTSPYSGPITVSGGKMRVYGNYASAPVTVSEGGMIALHDGSLNQVTSNPAGSLEGTGTVFGTLTNNGNVSPGFYNSPWILNVTGNYAQSAAGTFKVNIGSATEYGQLQITGTAALSGVLSIDMQNDYVPANNQVFPNIITASGGLSGTFSQIVVASEAPNLSWQPIYTANSFGLRAVPKAVVPQLYLLLLQD
jgi:autotransporter-associated beta strand protein